ncbi:MAG TPA: PA14 domain-containing protein, partial [Verrucomicrobiae bacterium]|nr:PA14 domain-containing protein [Verrucomicrobiae bacterium]
MKPHFLRILPLAALLLMSSPDARAQTGGILQEVFAGIPGSSIVDLTNAPAYPDSPTSTNVLSLFEAPANVDDNYGQRIRGYVIPPQTGAYLFWIASDDQSELYLSTDDSATRKILIANVNNWTAEHEWTSEPNQQSAPVSLVAGRRYYIEAL